MQYKHFPLSRFGGPRFLALFVLYWAINFCINGRNPRERRKTINTCLFSSSPPCWVDLISAKQRTKAYCCVAKQPLPDNWFAHNNERGRDGRRTAHGRKKPITPQWALNNVFVVVPGLKLCEPLWDTAKLLLQCDIPPVLLFQYTCCARTLIGC